MVRLLLLCGGENTGESNNFLYFLWYVDMGEDYTSQVDRLLTRIIRTYIFIYIIYCSTIPLVFVQSRLNVKVQVYFSAQFYLHMNAILFTQAFMRLCWVREWHLCCGEKTGETTTFLYFLCYADMAEDYTSQSRSEFDR